MARLKQLFEHISLSLSPLCVALRETGKNDINNSAYQLYTRQGFVANSSCCTNVVYFSIYCICTCVCLFYLLCYCCDDDAIYVYCPLHTSRCFLILLQQTVVSRRKLSIWQTGSIATSYIYTHTYAHMYLCTLLNEFTSLRHVPMVKYTQKVE